MCAKMVPKTVFHFHVHHIGKESHSTPWDIHMCKHTQNLWAVLSSEKAGNKSVEWIELDQWRMHSEPISFFRNQVHQVNEAYSQMNMHRLWPMSFRYIFELFLFQWNLAAATFSKIKLMLPFGLISNGRYDSCSIMTAFPSLEELIFLLPLVHFLYSLFISVQWYFPLCF